MKRPDSLFVSAVIVAAGQGARLNAGISKQYIEISGKPIIAWTLQTFEECDYIDEIVLVVGDRDIPYCKQEIIDAYGFGKVKILVAGGIERQNSVYNGLLEVDKKCDIVLIHDGVRPFVKEETLIDSIHTANKFGASGAAVPVKDTIKIVNADNFVEETLQRSLLWAIQTPQTFKYDLIMQAHGKAAEDGFTGTDDAILAERLGFRLKLVMGSYDNIKITTKEDLAIAEAIAGKIG